MQCAGCGKVIHVQVLHHLLLLQLQVQTFIYLQDKSPWYHSLTDYHSSLYATLTGAEGLFTHPVQLSTDALTSHDESNLAVWKYPSL